jgi:HK97 family phage major capsid protein
MLEEAKRLRAESVQLKEIEHHAQELARETEAEQGPDEEKGQRESPAEFKGWEEYLRTMWLHLHPHQDIRQRDPRLQPFKEKSPKRGKMEEKQMVEAVGASGGFLVPTEFLAQLQAVMGEQSIVRNRATIIRMRRRALQIPVLDQTATGTAGVPAWFGGMQAYWVAEATAKTLTEATFRQIELVAHKLIMYTRASDELLDDSAISLSDFLMGPMGFAGCITWMEDYAFLRGTGAGQPLGVITAVNRPTIVVARAVAGAIGIADLANMMMNFLPSGRGVWVISQSAMASMIQLAGPAGNPAYWWQPSGRDGVPGVLLGLPVIWSEKSPALGSQGDVLLADFNYYLVGDRQATTIESTEYDYWRYDQTSWRAVHRVDGQPWLSAPLTYQDQATTVSPFVILGGTVTS